MPSTTQSQRRLPTPDHAFPLAATTPLPPAGDDARLLWVPAPVPGSRPSGIPMLACTSAKAVLSLAAMLAATGCWGEPIPPGPMPVCFGRPAARGSLGSEPATCRSKAMVEEKMRSRSEYFTGCFEEAIRRNGDAFGFTTLRFEVTRAGDVPLACVTKTDIPDAAFVECATEAARSMTFEPDPTASCEVSTIEVPLVFVP